MSHHSLQWDMNLELALTGEYNMLVVFLSYAVAVLAGFCAFQITNFIQLNNSKRIPLLIMGGTVLGCGVWSMHFTAMLAFKLPVAVLYNPQITMLSVLPAIAASIVFLNNLSRKNISLQRVIVTGLMLSAGIATMHFIGMSAMSMSAYMSHDPMMSLFAVLASWGLAILTILIQIKRIKFGNIGRNLHLLISALSFGFAAATMHYLAMYSTYFFADNTIVGSGFNSKLLTNSLIVFAVLLMAFLMLILFYHNKISILIKLASSHHQRVIETIDNMQDGFMLSDDNGNILLINKKIQQNFLLNTASDIFINDDVNSFYTRLAKENFHFSTPTGTQELLEIVNSKSSLFGSFKVMDNTGNWWQLRQNRTSADTIIQTWTNISEQIAQENELVLAKNTALDTLQELRETQDELLEAKKMASLGGLISGVAHELNTPLGIGITSSSSIREHIEMIQAQVADGSIQKTVLESSLDTIVQFEALTTKNLNRMAKLIQQFKYISIDQDIEQSNEFPFSNIRNNIIKMWQKVLVDNQLSLVISGGENFSIVSFENTIIQVLSSLISNSVDHAYEDNQAGEIEIIATLERGRLQLLYRDNGRGIDQAIVNQIFEPFVTTKRHEGGVGLGLHITYNLVCQKLKGKITLVETPSGTSFLIDIPIV